jgi:GT2 family glycosyltransferase
MITIIYSTHKDKEYNDKFKTHLLNSVGLDNVQILEYQNNNQYSLAQVYNSGITESIYDIVVCCHNDIRLEKGWGVKLLEDYSKFPEFGIIGKAGSCYFSDSGVYWDRLQTTMVGQIWHHPPGQNKWINNYSVKLPFVVPVVTIDGLFISFDKNKIKHSFDETIGKFHFYDHCFCLPNYMDDVKIGVTSSFEITHESIGRPNTEFYETKIKFLEKYKSILPLDLKPSFIYGTKEKVEYNKKLGKVAVVIPTKSNLDLLFQCINSFYEFSDSRFYDFFVADTGSSEEEKQEIRKFIQDKNIKFIEYNYYNFAKINNDVVTNHIGKDYQYVLFCNNDIKLMSDVVGGMLNVFKNKPRVGTVGCRLHYGDNTIQHDGVLIYLKTTTKEIFTTHQNKLAYYKFTKDVSTCIGNTAGLMMININTFKQIGMFNEMYNECFEDVELNLNLSIRGLENYFLGTHCAYHFESKTREIEKSQTKMMDDYNGILIPFLQKNLQKLKNKIYFTN